MIVIDVGCARYGGDFSIERLIEEFHPSVLYGFDPSWQPGMFTAWDGLETSVVASNHAAWTHDGFVTFAGSGLGGHVSDEPISSAAVACVDLAQFIKDLPDEEEIVLKIDAEGAEYDLLDHLIEQEADKRLALAWVEWHNFGVPSPSERRAAIEQKIACELTEWRW